MAYSRIKVWIAAEILTASDLNAEHTGHINNENDLNTRLVAEISTRSTLEGEHDTLKTNLWSSVNNQVADNRVGQESIQDSAVHTANLNAEAVTDAKIAAANKDGAADIPCMRTIGTAAGTACAGNDSRVIHALKRFTSNGTFTAQSERIILQGCAAGGGGGSSSGFPDKYGGGGGGAGAYYETRLTVVVGTEYSVVLGTGGAGGTNPGGGHSGKAGSDGENTTFGVLVTILGGKGGKGGTAESGLGGDGGVTVGYPGGNSGGAGGNGVDGGAGGNGGMQLGGYSGVSGAGGDYDVHGSAGTGYGAGGGGGGANNSHTHGEVGGNGASGWLQITW